MSGHVSKAFRDRTGFSYVYASFGGDLYQKINDNDWQLLRARSPEEDEVVLIDILTNGQDPNPPFDWEGGFLYRIHHTPSDTYQTYYRNKEERDASSWGYWPGHSVVEILQYWP